VAGLAVRLVDLHHSLAGTDEKPCQPGAEVPGALDADVDDFAL
jgi:hypothetical protein